MAPNWYCPKCQSSAYTQNSTKIPMHKCNSMHGLTAPLIPVGSKGKHDIVEREDYVGKEDVFLNEGRPVMSVVTTRDDGQDCTIFAPTAKTGVKSNGMD